MQNNIILMTFKRSLSEQWNVRFPRLHTVHPMSVHPTNDWAQFVQTGTLKQVLTLKVKSDWIKVRWNLNTWNTPISGIYTEITCHLTDMYPDIMSHQTSTLVGAAEQGNYRTVLSSDLSRLKSMSFDLNGTLAYWGCFLSQVVWLCPKYNNVSSNVCFSLFPAVRFPEDVEDESTTFHPEYSHQLFGDE